MSISTFSKRKSFGKIQAQLPIRKISQHSRQYSRRKHRTQYDTLQSPQSQLKNYKRKDFTLLNQLSSQSQSQSTSKLQSNRTLNPNSLKLQSFINNKLQSSQSHKTIKQKQPLSSITRTKQTSTILSTDRTLNSKLLKSQQSHHNNKINPFKQYESPNKQLNINKDKQLNINKDKQLNTNKNKQLNINKDKDKQLNNNKDKIQQPTSRFNYDHHDTDLLTQLININKSKDSNPFINTARQKENNQIIQINNINSHIKNKKSQQSSSIYNNQSQPRSSITTELINKKQSQNQLQNEQINQQQQQINEQKFDDYVFGGQTQHHQQSDHRSQSLIKKKKSKLMPVPKVQSYISDKQKPKNWRQMNHYIPQTQQQHRMALQTYSKQKQKLNYFRQQKQISKLIQQYQLNKNSILSHSKRKVQSNKILQKIYQQKRYNQNNHISSLPQLKSCKEIILADNVEFCYNIQQNNQEQTQNNHNNKVNINSIPDLDKLKIKNLLAKNLNQKSIKNKQQNQNLKCSVSLSKFGFGSRQPRRLFQEQIIINQLQNVQKIQRKLRQKGIKFNPNHIRKSLINVRDAPTYKISTNVINGNNQNQEIQFPQKKLPSNQFYKVFPL